MEKSEQVFLEKHANNGKTYIHHPKWFFSKSGERYMPDFYCVEDDTYIEVVGTRQAFSASKLKYKRVITEHKIKLTFVSVCGALPRLPANGNLGNVPYVKFIPKKKFPKRLIFVPEITDRSTIREQLIFNMAKEVNKVGGMLHLSRKLGINYSIVYRIMHGTSHGSIKTWETIERHFYPRRVSAKQGNGSAKR